MHGLIDYYEKAEPAKVSGHVWTDQPIYLPPAHGLKVSRVNPQDDRDVSYEIVGRTDEIFDHPPLRSMRMESSEGAVIAKTKRSRPVIVLGGTNATAFRPSTGRQTPADVAMVVPVYGADQYDPAVRRRMQIYDFANVFYLPEDQALGFDEGFARLDHGQPVRTASLQRHRGFKLTDDAMAALTEWFVAYVFGGLSEDSVLLEYRREMTRSG